MIRCRLTGALLFLFIGVGACAGNRGKETQDPWTQWYTMSLPVRIASHRVSPVHARRFARFEKAVQNENYVGALRELQSSEKDPAAGVWAKILRGQLAGLHTRSCNQGQWLQLAQSDARISMIELLDDLSALAQDKQQVVADQAQTALARILVIARDCPGSRIVARRAQTQLPGLLSSLAKTKGNTLAPDLAYLHASILLEQEAWKKAEHWLGIAQSQGLDDPRISLALAQSFFGQKAYAKAQDKALQSAKDTPKQMPELASRGYTLAARSALAQGHSARATSLLTKALSLRAHDAYALALSVQMRGQSPLGCEQELADRLAPLWRLRWQPPASELFWAMDELLAQVDAQNPSDLSCLGAALIWNIDNEPNPALRGIRYYYAATIDARLGDTQTALGRALVARSELQSATSPRPSLPIQALIDALQSQAD